MGHDLSVPITAARCGRRKTVHVFQVSLSEMLYQLSAPRESEQRIETEAV